MLDCDGEEGIGVVWLRGRGGDRLMSKECEFG
jgi:hypothetical protein